MQNFIKTVDLIDNNKEEEQTICYSFQNSHTSFTGYTYDSIVKASAGQNISGEKPSTYYTNDILISALPCINTLITLGGSNLPDHLVLNTYNENALVAESTYRTIKTKLPKGLTQILSKIFPNIRLGALIAFTKSNIAQISTHSLTGGTEITFLTQESNGAQAGLKLGIKSNLLSIFYDPIKATMLKFGENFTVGCVFKYKFIELGYKINGSKILHTDFKVNLGEAADTVKAKFRNNL